MVFRRSVLILARSAQIDLLVLYSAHRLSLSYNISIQYLMGIPKRNQLETPTCTSPGNYFSALVLIFCFVMILASIDLQQSVEATSYVMLMCTFLIDNLVESKRFGKASFSSHNYESRRCNFCLKGSVYSS